MSVIPANLNLTGLNEEQVLIAREKDGDNKLGLKQGNHLIKALKNILTEPMVVLLLVASAIYLISGNPRDAIFLSSAVVLVAAISFFQDSKSRNALEKLKEFTQPVAKVIRNGQLIEIKSEELVIGDLLLIDEGTSVAADGTIIHSNDFSVNESILTGESLAAYKDIHSENNKVFQGTNVASGLAIAEITAIGNDTKLGKIGDSLSSIKEAKTPLEVQIGRFVKKMAISGAIFFVLIWVINYLRSFDVLNSLMKALTLAMSILPEEIPVAFTTFMALGAWRLMKMGIVVKELRTVETLGSASVICVDKTGTITQNKMELAKVYILESNEIIHNLENNSKAQSLIRDAMWASEPIPFDPMEKALHKFYLANTRTDERVNYHLIHEYPLDGKPPMMTHIFEDGSGKRIIAAKGAPEAFITISGLKKAEKEQILVAVNSLAAEGYRVLGIAKSEFPDKEFPKHQQQFQFKFQGLIAFYDPPKKNVKEVLADFYQAGIDVKIITGDNSLTTAEIARQVGLKGYEKSISGDELMRLDDKQLAKIVLDINIFSRMFPEAKLRIINALKSKGEIVAMTGDGVNDGPALKAAHIGIAMGRKGTELAKQASSMILLEDDLSKMIDAIRMGRKIYTNLKKAIRYVISIHIPIILIVFIPLTLGWVYPALFTPVHVIFLELIMGPTCSIIYENEPMEENLMKQAPRPITEIFFNGAELFTSVIQGLAITAGLIFVYHYSVSEYSDGNITRTMVFCTLIAANIFLTLINRSFHYSILKTIGYPNNLVIYIIILTIILTSALVFIKPLSAIFDFNSLTFVQLAISLLIGFVSVIWYELVKWNKRRQFSLIVSTKEIQ